MSVETEALREAIHGTLDAKIKSMESKLQMLRSRSEAAKTTAEIKAIAELASRRIQLHQKLEELRNSASVNWEHTKKNLESLVTEFERALKTIESRMHAH